MNWSKLFKGIYRAIRLMLGIIAILGLAAFLYLSIHGVPRRFVDPWLDRLQSQGYFVTVDRIRLDLMEGIVAEQFRAFEDKDMLLPMLEAEYVVLFLNPLDWLRHETGLRRLGVHNGLLRLSLVENPASADTDTIVARNINASVRFGSDAWHIDNLSADLLGLKISSRAKIRIPRTPDARINQSVIPTLREVGKRSEGQPARADSGRPGRSETQESEQQRSEVRDQSDRKSIVDSPATPRHANTVTHQLNALTSSQRERILELVRQLNAIVFSIPPHADITLLIDMENPGANEAAIRMEGAATRAFGVRFDQWRLRGSLKDGRAHLTEARLQQRGQFLECSGAYTFSNRLAEARFRGNLILNDWMILAPQDWRDALDKSGCTIDGPIQCDIRLDPCPVDQVMEHLRGQVFLRQAKARGMWIEQAMAGFTLGDHALNVNPFCVILGKGPEQSCFQGNLNYAWDTGAYDARLDALLDPRVLVSCLSSNAAEFANAFVFQDRPIALEADISGQAGRNASIWVAGGIQVSNFTYNAVPVISAQSRFGYANGNLSFDKLRVVRPEGEVTGRLSTLVDGTVLGIDLVSTCDPPAIARLIGFDIVDYLDGFHFAGPMRIAARGSIDYGTGAQTDIRADLDGYEWGYGRFDLMRGAMKVAVKQLRFDLTDIRGQAYEGDFSGRASFYPAAAGSNFEYNLYIKVTDVNLNTLLQSVGYAGKEEYEGLIYTECALAGTIGEGRGDTALGGGWIRIQDGQLFQLRLLGGFSRLLSVIDPGLGVVKLTDFAANFTVKGGKIDTRDAMLSGTKLAIHGEGYYAFDQHLDFIVWAQEVERQHFLPRLTQATSPLLGKLLAVRLTGTLAEPKWWPLNLTKDQLLALPKDILIDIPKDVLLGLPEDLLVNLPHDVLVTLPREILVELPKHVFIDLPYELFIKLPQDIWNMLRPAPSHPAVP